MSGWDQEYDIESLEDDMRASPDDLAHMRHSDDVAAERDQARRDHVAEQLERDHIEGMADDRVEAERREFRWDIEGWTADDRLIVHIAGMGTMHIPLRDVEQMANAMLAEHEIMTSGPQGDPWSKEREA